MKILIVSATDVYGGAGKAAYRLHKTLLNFNINSTLLVQRKLSSGRNVVGPTGRIREIIGYIRPYLDNFPVKLLYRKAEEMFSVSWLPSSSLIRKINSLNPDIVHIHWIGAGMIKIEDLERIDAHIVWTLHDMWAFTGGCHYNNGCERYISGCGKCRVLKSQKENDLSRRVFQRKVDTFSKIRNMTVISISKWIQGCSKRSAIFKEVRHALLPNPISVKKYHAIDKDSARKKLSLPDNVKLVLFGADISDRRKNFSSLVSALNMMPESNVECVVFGRKGCQNTESNFKVHYLGFVEDEQSLIDIYSAVDVLVVPSVQETFGLTVAESMACKTPVVGFNHTGVKDLIDHKVNGYLANFSNTDLRNGIAWVLDHRNYDNLCLKAREKVCSVFDENVLGKQYVDLYKSIIDR